jgi:diguanylate cyclase (GGDEF)-like protein
VDPRQRPVATAWSVVAFVACASAAAGALLGVGVLPAVAAAAVGTAVVRAVRADAGRDSRWWRGWALVALGLPPAVAGLALGPGDQLRAPTLLLAGTVLVAFGVVGALPGREPARAREVVVEAAIGGGVTAYLLGAALPALPGLSLAAVAVGSSAAWLLVVRIAREGEHVTGATRCLLAALVVTLVTHVALVLVPASTMASAGAVIQAATVVAVAVVLGCWAAAVTRPELAEPLPPALPSTSEVLHAGHVRVVLAGVLAGPMVVAAGHLDGRGQDLLEATVAGGALGAVAVLHLLQLVRDHGRRAWRARHDALTGLPSEPLFEDRVERAMARGRRTGTGFTVAFLDLDGFKQVNDRDGHDVGDEVLREVSLRLHGAVREEDTVARRSGDEFLVLLEGLDDRPMAERVAAKLLAALAEPIEVGARRHRLGASIGLATWPRDGDTPDALVRHADAAMYEAKERGRGAVRWYTSVATDRSRLRLTLAQQLEATLADGEQLELAFHPRVDLTDGRVVELVALVRWWHPELGLLLPRSFVPLAQTTGLGRELDLAVLEVACDTVRRWSDEGLPELPVLVHVAGSSLAHAATEADVVRVLRRTRLPAPRLRLGVTETAVGTAGAAGAANVADLAHVGVAVTVTRFGTGSVGVGTLATVPFGGIELASGLVAGLGVAGAPTAVRAALTLARELGLIAAAGGVSSAEQADRLRAAGCTIARGPHLGPPLLAHELERRLRDTASGPGPLLAADVAGDPLPGEELADVAAALAISTSPGGEGDDRALTEVLRRLEGTAPAGPATAPA